MSNYIKNKRSRHVFPCDYEKNGNKEYFRLSIEEWKALNKMQIGNGTVVLVPKFDERKPPSFAEVVKSNQYVSLDCKDMAVINGDLIASTIVIMVCITDRYLGAGGTSKETREFVYGDKQPETVKELN